jgi:hypothetical protein
LPVHVVLGYAKKQQRTNNPPEVSRKQSRFGSRLEMAVAVFHQGWSRRMPGLMIRCAV